MRKFSIGVNRPPRPEAEEYSLMMAMPTPTGWGETPRPAHGGRNMNRLECGTIRFDRLHVRIFPDKPILPPPVEDKIKGSLDEDQSRPVLPVVEQSPYPEPPVPRRAPVAEEILEYRHPGDSDTIRDELLGQMRMLEFRILCGIIVVLFLGALELLPRLNITLPDMFMPDKGPAVYLTLNLLMTGFCAVLCRNVLAGGWDSLKRLRPDGEGMLAFAAGFTFLQMIAEFVWYFVKHQPVHRVCGAPLALALLINDIGLLVLTRRVARNFRFVALRGMRMSARLMDDGVEFDEIIHADRRFRPCAAYAVRTKFLEKYLNFSYEEDLCESLSSRLTPFVLPFAALCGVLGGLVSAKEWGIWGGIYCAAAALIIGVPACRMLCLNLPMDFAAQRLLPRGVMLNGWAGADEFGKTDTLAVGSDALFPEGTVRMVAVKTFGEAPVERTMLYAASVVIAAGGPLAQVFEYIFSGKHDQLLPAEGIDYENERGVSGYVNSQTVLVGNRELLRLHQCRTPSKDYEGILRCDEESSLVYIAIGGIPCAVMQVRYSADMRTVRSVQRMVENGVSLVVYTCDANVTRELISRIYNIPQRYISMLSTRAGSQYDRITHTILDKAPAILATNGQLSALADGLTAARRLRPLLVFATAIEMICWVICLMLVVVLCCISGSAAVDPAQLMMMQTICLLVNMISLFRKII